LFVTIDSAKVRCPNWVQVPLRYYSRIGMAAFRKSEIWVFHHNSGWVPCLLILFALSEMHLKSIPIEESKKTS